MLAYRFALWLYWLPERRAYIRQHGALSVAYGEGKFDAVAILTTMGFLVALAVVAIVLPRIRPLKAFFLGAAAAILACTGQWATGKWLGEHLGGVVAMHGPTVLSLVMVLLLVRWLSRRSTTQAAAAV